MYKSILQILMKRGFLFVFFNLLFLCFAGKAAEICTSLGGRFPPFSSHGRYPMKANRGHKDLTLCRVFRRKTCCDIRQTHLALLTIRKLALAGEANQECLQLWELLECSVCDPRIGVKPGPPLICASLCEKIFNSCFEAYFSMDTKMQVLGPCGVGDLVCGRASEWVSNATELCRAVGFDVKLSDVVNGGRDETYCYGGKASFDSIATLMKVSNSPVSEKNDMMGSYKNYWENVREIPFREKVSWAVGGMVLTAGLFLLSKRESRKQKKERRHVSVYRRTAAAAGFRHS